MAIKSAEETLHLTRKALGILEQDGTRGQLAACISLIEDITQRARALTDQLRVDEAQATVTKRIPKGHSDWGVHMSHCYSWDHDFLEPGEQPTHRFSCKYNEDDICPAALYDDPWAEYLKSEKEAKKSG